MDYTGDTNKKEGVQCFYKQYPCCLDRGQLHPTVFGRCRRSCCDAASTPLGCTSTISFPWADPAKLPELVQEERSQANDSRYAAEQYAPLSSWIEEWIWLFVNGLYLPTAPGVPNTARHHPDFALLTNSQSDSTDPLQLPVLPPPMLVALATYTTCTPTFIFTFNHNPSIPTKECFCVDGNAADNCNQLVGMHCAYIDANPNSGYMQTTDGCAYMRHNTCRQYLQTFQDGTTKKYNINLEFHLRLLHFPAPEFEQTPCDKEVETDEDIRAGIYVTSCLYMWTHAHAHTHRRGQRVYASVVGVDCWVSPALP